MIDGFRRENLTEKARSISAMKLYPAFWLLIIFLSACENDLSTVNKITSKNEALKEAGKDVQAYYSDWGRVKARLDAPVMNHVNDPKNPYTELPSGLKLVFFNPDLQ